MTKPIYIRLSDFRAAALDADDCPQPPIGSTHFWGDPDLPADCEYPTFFDDDLGDNIEMTFICQINLADLPEDVTALPHKGLLSFFAELSYYEGYGNRPNIYMSDSSAVKVLYFPEITDEFSRVVMLDEDNSRSFPEARAITFSANRPPIGEEEHQLLGEATHREWEDWESPCEGWQLLLQVDSCEGSDYNYNFIDCGVLNFIIDPADLARHDFSRVRALILST